MTQITQNLHSKKSLQVKKYGSNKYRSRMIRKWSEASPKPETNDELDIFSLFLDMYSDPSCVQLRVTPSMKDGQKIDKLWLKEYFRSSLRNIENERLEKK